MDNKFVVVDLETTGNSPKKGDRIIQIGAVVIENGKIIERYSSLVNPGKQIPVFIEELTGIDDEMVKDAPDFTEIAGQILHLLDGAFFVAHNVFFDLSFLQEELLKVGYEGFFGPVIDTVEMARILFPSADSYKLSDLAVREGLAHDRPHQADSDAEVTAELLLILLERIRAFPIVTIKSLSKLSSGLKSDLYMLFEDAITLKERSIEEIPEHIDIFRGIAMRKAGAPEEKETELPCYPITPELKVEMLQKAIPKYEPRQGQLQMMDDVYGAFEKGVHTMIEAGTGIGKTLAYLVPAAIFSRQHNKTVVVSTYTTQLQQQLLQKDVPILEDILGQRVKTALLKGRSHYINLARFEVSMIEEEDNYDTALTKMQILVWLTETETGDYDELNLSSGGMIYWNKIKNDHSVFMKTNHWQQKDFFLRARRASESADIIITNHAMLLSDLTADQPFIPQYDHVILDEAHQFEKAAGRYFGETLEYLSIRLLINQLGLYEQKQVFGKLEDLVGEKASQQTPYLHTFELNHLIALVHSETDALFKAASGLVKKSRTGKGPLNRVKCRLPKSGNNNGRDALYVVAERFSFMIRDIVEGLEQRLKAAEPLMPSLEKNELALLEEAALLAAELEGCRAKVRNLVLYPDPDYVTWIETDLRSNQNTTTIYGRPADVSPFLRDRFFCTKQCVILTSATLSVKNSFEFLKKELGMDSVHSVVKQIASPFDYGKQVQLFVPKDIPEIKSVSDEEYIASITEHIISIAEATKGRMLILFTSHDMLKKTYELIKESGMLDDYAMIAQGITAGSRSRLTRNFQKFDKAILFGTSSFWEGVDIPGEDLSCLIIVRLPFSPPDEPVTEAKCDQIRKRGGSPFSELSLPEAVLRFKQGFGRLVRTTSDRGIVVVFDRRLVTASYGRAFLESIPDVPVRKVSVQELTDSIEKWL
ncbi:ATP-dependent DNA helicase DinG [Mesobacillus zeae]|uniref:3'-5' exonuclease DinG n=1 Tax=Mesobacillus zeae TaxID=1917180 RepID=A0A398B4B1_9BACI|nr:ATP-dependent DNA helicase DinG [Mesobacillus zeae]RID82553.1 ATP-dependent helicase DinG [Mesobacillus zeae]